MLIETGLFGKFNLIWISDKQSSFPLVTWNFSMNDTILILTWSMQELSSKQWPPETFI